MIPHRIAAAWGAACLRACGGPGEDNPAVALLQGSGHAPRDSPALAGVVTLTHDPAGAIIGWTAADDSGTGGSRPQLLLVPPCVEGRLHLRRRWRLLQIYLPIAGIHAIAAEIGVPLSLCRIRFAPGFVTDADLLARAAAMELRLREGLVCGRLEIDELALDLSLALLTRHARLELANGVVVPEAAASASARCDQGDSWREALVAEAAERLASGTDGAPALLGRVLRILAAVRRAESGRIDQGS